MNRTEFIIVEPAPVDPTDIMVFSFYAHDPGYYHSHLQLLGSYAGNPYQDDAFRSLLDRVRGRLMMRGVCYCQNVSRLNLKEYRKLTADQKMQRKLSKLYNERTKRAEAIMQSGSLFTDAELVQLQNEYEAAVLAVKSNYNQEIN